MEIQKRCKYCGSIEGFYNSDMSDAMLRGNPQSDNCYSIYPDRNATVIDETQVVSGELCYMLNEGDDQPISVWYQTLGWDEHPVLNAARGEVLLADDGTYFNEEDATRNLNVNLDLNVKETIYNLSGQVVNGKLPKHSHHSHSRWQEQKSPDQVKQTLLL